MESSARVIPNFIKARSPQGLRRLMVKNNIRMGMEVRYISINFVNGEWVAWYYENFDFNQEVLEQTKSASGE